MDPLEVQGEWRRWKRRMEKEMKNDPEQRERIQETKRKRREFIEKHAKKFKVDESAGRRTE